VIHQGDRADCVCCIEQGVIKISVLSEHGKVGVIGILSAGEFFGIDCLAGQSAYSSSAVAQTRSTIIRIPKKSMVRMMHADPAVADIFTEFLLTRTMQIQADLVDHLFNSSEKRLARTLLQLANFGDKDGEGLVVPHISQDVLAARVGTTRSRINFFMNKFRRLGFVEYDGFIKVNPSLINVIVSGTEDLPPAVSRSAKSSSRRSARPKPGAGPRSSSPKKSQPRE